MDKKHILLKKINKMNSLKTPYSRFLKNDKFINIWDEKIGIVVSYRNDSCEKIFRINDSYHHYYHVKYQDGTFDTYCHQKYMDIIIE